MEILVVDCDFGFMSRCSNIKELKFCQTPNSNFNYTFDKNFKGNTYALMLVHHTGKKWQCYVHQEERFP